MNKYSALIWVSFSSNSSFEMPTIHFKRTGGEYSGARLYLERDVGNWTGKQIEFLKATYGRPVESSKRSEVWRYVPNNQTNVESAVMENVQYRCVLEIFSPKKPPVNRDGGKCFLLPSPPVASPGFPLSFFAPKFDAIEDSLGLLPADVRIEPSCWRALNFGNSHIGAPLLVETPSNFRPRILSADENPETSQAIDSFFNGDANEVALAAELKGAVNDLAKRFDLISVEQYGAFGKRGIKKPIWQYKIPGDLYSRLNFDFGTALTRRLQQKNRDDDARFVVPMRMALCSVNRNNVYNRSWEFKIEILPQTSLAGSVVVLDCGTSSCYACFTHPALAGQNLLATSDEQAECRRANLNRWLTDPNARDRKILDSLLLETLDALEPNSPNKGKLESVDERLNSPVSGYLQFSGLFKFMRTFEYRLRRQLNGLFRRKRDELSPEDNRRRDAYISFTEKLYEIDAETFETYPEKLKKVKSANLDSNSRTIVSEFLFKEDEYGVPDGTLGIVDFNTRLLSAKGEYLKKYKSFAEQENNLPPIDVQFYQNPKSHIFHIHSPNLESARVYQGFMNGVLQKVLREYRAVHWNGDEIPYLALTYPATLSPMGRRRLRELAMQLGFPKVDLSCDESVAPAIFYLDKFCGASNELGLENFKTRCARIGDLWYHNMLIVDVGAGTTDVSLVQFEIEERYPKEANVDGGREYFITPYLLASQGNKHFAGNYLTLAIFYYLRALLVLSKDKNEQALKELNQQPDLLSTSDGRMKDVKANAARQLPTDFMPNIRTGEAGITEKEFEARYRRFNALWNLAEQVKIQMSDEQRENQGKVCPLDLKPLLNKFRDEINWELPQNELFFDGTVFETLQNSLINKIVNDLIVGLTREALVARQENEPKLESACRGVNTVILSGCSARLPNLEKILKETIDRSASGANGAPQRFATTRTEVRFENKYAKSATALGAASAWNVVHHGFVNVNDNHELMNGFCTSQIDIKNLSFYLSSSYVDVNSTTTYFKLQSKFVRRGLGVKELFSIMSSEWYGYVASFQIGKAIGDLQPNPPDYAEFNFETFRDSVRAVNQGYVKGFDNQNKLVDLVLNEKALKVRFEIDLDQLVYVLIGRVNEFEQNDGAVEKMPPDYLYTVKVRGIDHASYEKYGFQIKLPKEWAVMEEETVRLAEDVTLANGSRLFDKDRTFNYKCLDVDKSTLLCCWSQNSFKPFVTKAHTTQLLSKNATVEFNLDSYYQAMQRFGVPEDELREIELKVMLTVKLNEQGKPDLEALYARIFVGEEPAYAETEDVKEWTNTPGLVYRQNITKFDPYFTDEYNPFSGKH